MAAEPPSGASSADLVRWLIDRINAKDIASMRAAWSGDGVERFPDETCHGTDAIAAYFDRIWTGMPDYRMEILVLAEQDDHVFIRWRATGTHTGVFAGIEPTGRSIAVDGMDDFEIRGGRIASSFVIFDQMQVARQLGLLPADGSPADRAMKSAFNVKTRLAELINR